MIDKNSLWMDDDRENIEFYSRLASIHESHAQAQNWGSASSQRLRFSLLAGIGNLSGTRILDIGCGLGDFYLWLTETGYDLDYTGIDLTPKMIEYARQRISVGRFIVANLLDDEQLRGEKFDYVFSSGIFYLRKAAPVEYMHQVIARMYDLCRKGVAFNSLSAWADNPDPGEFYADPAKTLEYCRQLTLRVVLRHDYHPHDFTMYLYKGEQLA